MKRTQSSQADCPHINDAAQCDCWLMQHIEEDEEATQVMSEDTLAEARRQLEIEEAATQAAFNDDDDDTRAEARRELENEEAATQAALEDELTQDLPWEVRCRLVDDTAIVRHTTTSTSTREVRGNDDEVSEDLWDFDGPENVNVNDDEDSGVIDPEEMERALALSMRPTSPERQTLMRMLFGEVGPVCEAPLTLVDDFAIAVDPTILTPTPTVPYRPGADIKRYGKLLLEIVARSIRNNRFLAIDIARVCKTLQELVMGEGEDPDCALPPILKHSYRLGSLVGFYCDVSYPHGNVTPVWGVDYPCCEGTDTNGRLVCRIGAVFLNTPKDVLPPVERPSIRDVPAVDCFENDLFQFEFEELGPHNVEYFIDYRLKHRDVLTTLLANLPTAKKLELQISDSPKGSEERDEEDAERAQTGRYLYFPLGLRTEEVGVLAYGWDPRGSIVQSTLNLHHREMMVYHQKGERSSIVLPSLLFSPDNCHGAYIDPLVYYIPAPWLNMFKCTASGTEEVSTIGCCDVATKVVNAAMASATGCYTYRMDRYSTYECTLALLLEHMRHGEGITLSQLVTARDAARRETATYIWRCNMGFET
jgi:hypothetical protein